jgi:hypothetical protein
MNATQCRSVAESVLFKPVLQLRIQTQRPVSWKNVSPWSENQHFANSPTFHTAIYLTSSLDRALREAYAKGFLLALLDLRYSRFWIFFLQGKVIVLAEVPF